MTDQGNPNSTINGKATKVGDKVQYNDSAGKKHDATIQSLDGENAGLDVNIDGISRQFASVPHSVDPIGHSWKHCPDQA